MSVAGRMSGRTASSSGPCAWILGLALIFAALANLQVDRLAYAKISTVSAIEYALSDTADDIDDAASRLTDGKPIGFIPVGGFAPRLGGSHSLLSRSNKPSRRDVRFSRHARGPPVNI